MKTRAFHLEMKVVEMIVDLQTANKTQHKKELQKFYAL